MKPKSTADIVKTLRKTDKDFAKKTDQMITFLQLYVDTGDHKQAWIDAGYSPSSVSQAMKYIRENMKHVEKMVNYRIGSHIPAALNTIVQLLGAKQEAVRLKAAQDILHRGGYDKPMEIVTSDKAAEELNNSELEEELTKLLKKANSTEQPTLQ